MLIDLGLIDERAGWPLTQEGGRLARLYGRGKVCGPLRLTGKACLSCISAPEKKSLRALIGLSSEVRNPDESLVKRKDFIRELRRRFLSNKVPPIGALLEKYESIPGGRNLPLAQHLYAANAWEWLSLGSNALFVSWVMSIRGKEEAAFKKALCRAMSVARNSRKQQKLNDIEIGDTGMLLGKALLALRHALRLKRLANPILERADIQSMFTKAAELLDYGAQNNGKRVDQFLETLGHLHQDAKGDDVWIMPASDGRWRVSENQPKLPDRVSLHSYRVAAFRSIVHDLGGLRE